MLELRNPEELGVPRSRASFSRCGGGLSRGIFGAGWESDGTHQLNTEPDVFRDPVPLEAEFGPSPGPFWHVHSVGCGSVPAPGVTSIATVLRDPKDGPVVTAASGQRLLLNCLYGACSASAEAQLGEELRHGRWHGEWGGVNIDFLRRKCVRFFPTHRTNWISAFPPSKNGFRFFQPAQVPSKKQTRVEAGEGESDVEWRSNISMVNPTKTPPLSTRIIWAKGQGARRFLDKL